MLSLLFAKLSEVYGELSDDFRSGPSQWSEREAAEIVQSPLATRQVKRNVDQVGTVVRSVVGVVGDGGMGADVFFIQGRR